MAEKKEKQRQIDGKLKKMKLKISQELLAMIVMTTDYVLHEEKHLLWLFLIITTQWQKRKKSNDK